MKMKIKLHWNSSSIKPLHLIIHLFVNIVIYCSMFKQHGFIDQLCGPLAIPAAPQLLTKVIYLQFAYFLWPFTIFLGEFFGRNNKMTKMAKQSKFIKVIFIMILRTVFITFYQDHRNKYYLHVLLIQVIILIATIVFDFIGHTTISQVWEIIMTDCFYKIAIFYEVTRTFCANFAVYWFFLNLLIMILSQIQAHAFYEHKDSQKLQPIYPVPLYVKQDIYRLLIMSFIYYGLYAFLQAQTYGYGMLITFLLSLGPFLFAINNIKQAKYKASLLYLSLAIIFACFFVLIRIQYPHFFKRIQPKHAKDMCLWYDFS